MSAHITLSSQRHDWRTPGWFLELVRNVGPIVCDPASAPTNPTGAEAFFAPPDAEEPAPGWLGACGLSGVWPDQGLNYINPRYGPFLSGPVAPSRVVWRQSRETGGRRPIGIGTGWAARIAAHEGEALALVPARTGSRWWRTLRAWCDWCVLWSSPVYGARINFIDPETGEVARGSNLDSSVFYRGPRRRRFRAVFAPHGELICGSATLAALEHRRRPRRRCDEDLQLTLGGP